MRKAKYVAAVLMLSVMVCGCQKQTNTVSIYDKGLEIVHSMEELAQSDIYSQVVGVNALQESVDKIKEGDYKSPKSVYKITLSEDIVSKIMTSEEQDALGFKDMSPMLKQTFFQKVFQSIPIQMNGYLGSTAVATVGTYTVSQTFASSEIKDNLYYVYVFDKGFPVIVDFTVGEDHAISATGHYIMTTDFEDSMDGIHALMNEPINIECEIQKVDK